MARLPPKSTGSSRPASLRLATDCRGDPARFALREAHVPNRGTRRPAKAGVTVIDLTRALAGPYGTMLLGELGARIIKVEPPGGDQAREIGPHVAGQSAYFMSLNRGKESIVLDLKDAADREIFEAMVRRADVLCENYRAGTMEKLGYGWDVLKGLNPRLIYAATSGFGQTGPYRHRPAYDMVVQAMGGIMSITGQPGGAPTRGSAPRSAISRPACSRRSVSLRRCSTGHAPAKA